MLLHLQSTHVFPRQGLSNVTQREAPKTIMFCKKLHQKNHPSPRICLSAEYRELSPTCGIGNKDAVIIVDHGSRRKESNLMLNEFVSMFKDKTRYPIVEAAHMELAEPSIRDAFHSCVQQGASRIIVSPFFLFPGRHWNQDIPKLAHDAAMEHPGISYIVTAPLGLHNLLVDVVDERIKYCLSHVGGREDECSVCAGTGKCQMITPS